MTHGDVLQTIITCRPAYAGRPLKPGAALLEGKPVTLGYGWSMDDGDKYPGECALVPHDEATMRLFMQADITWIASGDVE